MKINISNLKDGEHIYRFEEEPTKIEVENAEFVDNIIVDVNLSKYANQFNLDISVKGKYKLTCDRCLDNYVTGFENDFNLIYKYDFEEGEAANEENDQDDILKYISPKTQFIELGEDVRDYIILSIPMRKVPEDNDRVCVYCNRKIDDILESKATKSVNPVWDKLLKIKKN